MQPRTLDAILAELNPVYAPQESLYRQRQADIPGQIQAEEAGLNAKKDVAYEDILGGARRRGLGFAGIPLAEQAKYNATDYLPAVARLRQSGRDQAQNLEEAILGINERKNTAALGMRQYEQQRYDQYLAELRQQEEARRAKAAAEQNSWLSAFAKPGGAVAGASTRPSLASIFGMGGNAAPALRVGSATPANKLLPSGQVNVTPTYNPQFGVGINTGYSPVLQGAGAIGGKLRVR